MNTRKEILRKLSETFVINGIDILAGSWNIHFLQNNDTEELCQIAECTNIDNKETPMAPHTHTLSREIFYVLKGAITINEERIEAGNIKIIEPNIEHTNIIHKDSACIVIVQPIEPAYPKGGKNGSTVGTA